MVSRRASARSTKLRYDRKACFSRPCRVLQIRHITAFRELERSRLGGRSPCIGGAAGERCDGGSVKAAVAVAGYDYVTSGKCGARSSF